MSEKTQPATPYKLQKAKEAGQVNQSIELNTSVFLFVMFGVLLAYGPSCLATIKRFSKGLFYLAGKMSLKPDAIDSLQQQIGTELLQLWMPLALASVLTIIGVSVAQIGWVWSGTPIKPTLSRLSPSNGLKRLVSSKSLITAGKGLLKFALVLIGLSIHIRLMFPDFLAFLSMPIATYPTQVRLIASQIVLHCFTWLFIMAMVDKYYTSWRFAKEQRMSKQDIQDEYRQREGDPKIKAKIKQFQNQLRQKTASIANVAKADVVITNPTHIAVALQYDRTCMPAPKVVCKVQGDLVAHVKRIAMRHSIPIVPHKSLARRLFIESDVHQWIKRSHFPMVALVFRDVYRKRGAIQ